MSDIKGSGVEAESSADVKMHLDKSHICAHTYPDFQDKGQICSFRIDIDIATCGEISPLNALNFMLEAFESDVVVCDYVVRGYTRDENGKRIYIWITRFKVFKTILNLKSKTTTTVWI